MSRSGEPNTFSKVIIEKYKPDNLGYEDILESEDLIKGMVKEATESSKTRKPKLLLGYPKSQAKTISEESSERKERIVYSTTKTLL